MRRRGQESPNALTAPSFWEDMQFYFRGVTLVARDRSELKQFFALEAVNAS